MKTIAFTLGCGIVTLLTTGIAILATVLLLNRSGHVSYAGTPASMGRIMLYTPAPIPFTPQPVISFSTVTPSSSFMAASAVTLTLTPTPTLIVATSTPLAATEVVSQAETSSSAAVSATTLPDRRPEAMGSLSKREGNSIFVSAGPDSETTVEIVVTDGTVIYRDNTDMPQPGGPGRASPDGMTPPGGAPPGNSAPPGNGMSPGDPPTVQMDVERVDSLDDISSEAMIFAWGEQQDNQVTAQIIVYHLFE